MIRIAIIVGTRPGRKAAAVAEWVHQIASARSDAQYEVIDVADYQLPLPDELNRTGFVGGSIPREDGPDGTTQQVFPELRERAVRMVFEHAHEHPSQWATIRSVAEKLGCTVEALRRWVRQAEGGRAGAVLWRILIGIVYAEIGFYVLTNPVAGLASPTLAVAIYLIIEGVIESLLSSQLRPRLGSGWLFRTASSRSSL